MCDKKWQEFRREQEREENNFFQKLEIAID